MSKHKCLNIETNEEAEYPGDTPADQFRPNRLQPKQMLLHHGDKTLKDFKAGDLLRLKFEEGHADVKVL